MDKITPIIAKPQPRVGTYRTRVANISVLSSRVKQFTLAFDPPQVFHFQAGQYVQALVPISNHLDRRAYSIASPPSETHKIELCMTHVLGGEESTYFHQLKGGETIDVMGPLGRFILPPDLSTDVVFIATGSGIAPFRSMVMEHLSQAIGRNFYLIFGNRTEDDLLYKELWEEFQRTHPNFHVLNTLSRPSNVWTGEKGYVQEKIQKFIPTPLEKNYYICGLNKMVEQTQNKLLSLGVPKEQIHYERYD